MSKYKVLNPIGYKGSRLERGTIIEISDEEASSFGKEYLALESEPATAGESQVLSKEEKLDEKVEDKGVVKPKRTRKSKK